MEWKKHTCYQKPSNTTDIRCGQSFLERPHISALAEQCLEQTESSKLLYNSKQNPELQLSKTRPARKTPGRSQLTLQHGWASLEQQSLHIVPQKHTPVNLPQPTGYLPFPTQFGSALVECSHGISAVQRKHCLVWKERNMGKQFSRGIWENSEETELEKVPKSFKGYSDFTCL